MTHAPISRRRILAVAGTGLGVTALACAGIGLLTGRDPAPSEIDLESTYGKENQMPNPVLVTYASRTGWTVGVAEAIAKTLTESGVPAEAHRMQDMQDLSPYRAVVAGSGINGGKWLPEATQFVERHRAALAQKPFASFLVCMTLAMRGGEQYRDHVATWLEPVRGFSPVSEGLFAGGLEVRRLPFKDRLQFKISVMMGVWKEGDHRDWNAIRTWATNLAGTLQHA